MSRPSRPALTVVGLPGIPEVRAGDDLAALLVAALEHAGLEPVDGDVLVVASKVVSKAAGLSREAPSRAEAIADETVRVVASRRTPVGITQIVQSRSGPVMAAAGVDASNTPAGTVLTLPLDPDGAARALRADLRRRFGAALRLGVVVSDTSGRPWRDGVSDIALGAAGLAVLDDLRGRSDGHGHALEVTVRAIADEVAAAADLVKGKLAALPAAHVRGLGDLVTDDDGPGAGSVLRGAAQDWFRYGHVEAVRQALATGFVGTADPVEPPALGSEDVLTRAERALTLALDGLPGHVTARVGHDPAPDEGSPEVILDLESGSPYAMGLVVGRLHVALWSEHLVARRLREEPGQARFTVRELAD